jgi:hypothetical protein
MLVGMVVPELLEELLEELGGLYPELLLLLLHAANRQALKVKPTACLNTLLIIKNSLVLLD